MSTIEYKFGVTRLSDCRHISTKLQGVISQKTAIFKHKKNCKNSYIIMKNGDGFTPHFKKISILCRHNLSAVSYLFNYLKKKGNEILIVWIVRRNAKDVGAEW
jgi:hypothetical protein